MKKIVLILSLFSLFTAYSMEEIEEEEASDIVDQCVPGAVFDLSLCQQAINVILPKALALYESEGYQAFDNYLALPDDVKFKILFARMNEDEEYTYIFAQELQRLFTENPTNALDYFNKFENKSKGKLMTHLLRNFNKSQEIKDLFSLLFENINDYDVITEIAVFLDLVLLKEYPENTFLRDMHQAMIKKITEFIEQKANPAYVIPPYLADENKEKEVLSKFVKQLITENLDYIIIPKFRFKHARYLILKIGTESWENAEQIIKAMPSFMMSLADTQIEEAAFFNTLYNEFIELYPDIEPLIIRSHANYALDLHHNPKVKILEKLRQELVQRLFDLVDDYLQKGEIEDALDMLQDVSTVPVIDLILALELGETQPLYFENLMELTLGLIVQKKLTQEEKGRLFAHLLAQYQAKPDKTDDFLTILERVFQKLPVLANDLLDEFKEFYWHHVPERAIKKAKIETGTEVSREEK